MTDIDTSREAVESLANCHDEKNPHYSESSLMLRALLARAEAAESERDADKAEVERLLEVLAEIVSLRDNTSPFGGELQDDRIERTFDRANAALQENTND